MKEEDSINYVLTTFCYSVCKIPLCKESRKNKNLGKLYDCLEEHLCSGEAHLHCSDHVIGNLFSVN